MASNQILRRWPTRPGGRSSDCWDGGADGRTLADRFDMTKGGRDVPPLFLPQGAGDHQPTRGQQIVYSLTRPSSGSRGPDVGPVRQGREKPEENAMTRTPFLVALVLTVRGSWARRYGSTRVWPRRSAALEPPRRGRRVTAGRSGRLPHARAMASAPPFPDPAMASASFESTPFGHLQLPDGPGGHAPGYVHALCLWAAASGSADVTRLLVASFLFFALLGNVLGKLRRNSGSEWHAVDPGDERAGSTRTGSPLGCSWRSGWRGSWRPSRGAVPAALVLLIAWPCCPSPTRSSVQRLERRGEI